MAKMKWYTIKFKDGSGVAAKLRARDKTQAWDKFAKVVFAELAFMPPQSVYVVTKSGEQ